jgi:hypothetical protein
VHLERLVQLEYVRLHSGQNGSLYTYSLLFDGDAQAEAPQLVGLASTDPVPTLRGKAATLRGQTPDLAGGLRLPCGDPAATPRPAKKTKKAGKTAAKAALPPRPAEKARSRRINGHAVVEH